jgi:hypothetical protein
MPDERGSAAVSELLDFSSGERNKTGGRCPPRPPGIYRFRLAPNKEESKRRAVAGPPDSDLVGHKPPDRRSGRIPALPYPPLEHAKVISHRARDKRPKAEFHFCSHVLFCSLQTVLFCQLHRPLLLTTAVLFCSHRDTTDGLTKTDHDQKPLLHGYPGCVRVGTSLNQ